jgi:hypothetical protein
VIIPAEYADHEGAEVFGSSVPAGFTPRFQFLFYDFELPPGPIDITGFRLRPKAYTGNVTVEHKGLQVMLTTTQEMSLVAGAEANLDLAIQSPDLVIDGDVVTQTTRQSPPVNPKGFDYEVSWASTPFRYDPADGNLLLDWNVTGGIFGPGGGSSTPAWDAANVGFFQHEGQSLRRTVLFDGLDSRFPIMEIIYTPVDDSRQFGDWGAPVSAEAIPGTSSQFNTEFNDGCPYQSPDGLSFYMASNRPDGVGGIDIWAAYRDSKEEPFGAPVNLPSPINSAADDFCPSPVPDDGLYFVSTREGGYGGGDIYFSREEDGVWSEPRNLGSEINSPAGEASPSYFEDEQGNSYLYFSSNREGGFEPGSTDSDIYFSMNSSAAQLVPGVNTASDDFRPNVRKDGREIVFDSNREGGLGGFDIWTANRDGIGDDWQTPLNVLAANSEANETRASLSWDGTSLVFGSNRPGSEGQADIYVAARERLRNLYTGDIDRDGVLAAADIDGLTAAIINRTNSARFDLNEDAHVDLTDHSYWVTELKQTWFGDANLDGVFDSGDLVDVLSAGKYELGLDASWSTGDFDGSGRFDSGDLIVALADGGYEQGPRAAVSAVPEPASFIILSIGLICIWTRRQHVGR